MFYYLLKLGEIKVVIKFKRLIICKINEIGAIS